MLKVRGSISTKRGRAPSRVIAAAVANVNGSDYFVARFEIERHEGQ